MPPETPEREQEQRKSKEKEEEDNTNKIGFTPTKLPPPRIPYVWDRKPSTPLATRRPKTRKLWKRFRSSFHSTRARVMMDMLNNNYQGRQYWQQQQGYGEDGEDTILRTEINMGIGKGLVFRGVKRLRLNCDGGIEGDLLGNSGYGCPSFLETKWEEEQDFSRRRKREFLFFFSFFLFLFIFLFVSLSLFFFFFFAPSVLLIT